MWKEKSEKQKLSVIHKGYKILRKLATKQIVLLEHQRNDRSFVKSSRHNFIFFIIKSFWEDADFAFSLKNKKWKYYAAYSVRTMMEKCLKLSYFFKQVPSRQDDITDKEFLFFSKIHYDFLKLNSFDTTEAVKCYNDLRLNTKKKYPDVDKISIGALKAFHPYDQLCQNDKEYIYYRWLSGIPHGQLVHLMSLETNTEAEYRNFILKGNLFCYKILTLTDKYLNGVTETEVKEAINKAKNLITMPSFIHKIFSKLVKIGLKNEN